MREHHLPADVLAVSVAKPQLREDNDPSEASASDPSTPSDSSPSIYNVPVRRKNDLQFITFTDPDQSRGAKNRKIVRSHAMRHVRQQRSDNTDSALVSRISGTRSSRGSSTSMANASGTVNRPMKVSETSFQVDFLKPRTVPTTHMAGTVRTYPPSKSPSPVTPLGAGRVDPFLNSAVEIRPYMNLLIDHFVHIVGPSHMPIEGAHSPIVTEFFPLARENPALFHGILCVTASHITILKGERNPQYLETFHRGESFRLLGSLLSDGKQATSDIVVATILFLSGFEVLFGLSHDHEAHMSGLDKIIAARGGLDNLGYKGLLKIMISWAFHFRTQRRNAVRRLIVDSEPGSGSPINIKGPHTPELLHENINKSQLTGFRLIHRKGLLNADIIRSAEMLLSLTLILNDHPAPTLENFTIISENRMKVEELLEKQHGSFSLAPQGTIEECCCIALLLYDHTVLRVMPRGSAIIVEHSTGLKDALTRISLDIEVWGTDRQLLLWILFIGYSSTIDVSMRYWFARQAQEIVLESPWIIEAKDLQKILKTFLWSEKGHVRSFDELWSLMINNTAEHGHDGHVRGR